MRLLAQSTDRPLEPYPDVLPPLEYPEHFEVRKVSTNGGIRWHSRWINISSAPGNEFIGLEPIGPALWQVYFGPTTLRWFDEEVFVIFNAHGNTGRNPICQRSGALFRCMATSAVHLHYRTSKRG